jgi:CheY-like chemotaxis protein
LGSGGGRETIVAVDDEEAVLELAIHHLTSLGYNVLSARSGEEALEVLRQREDVQVDLLFSDVVMPGGINGLVLAERARTLRPGLRVLLASGYSDDLVAQAPATVGIAALSKPYSQTELASRVRAALDSDDSGPNAAEASSSR